MTRHLLKLKTLKERRESYAKSRIGVRSMRGWCCITSYSLILGVRLRSIMWQGERLKRGGDRRRSKCRAWELMEIANTACRSLPLDMEQVGRYSKVDCVSLCDDQTAQNVKMEG